MKYRTLGRTGVKVSPLCLGAMMFGQWGNPDHDDSIAVIHKALDAGINFIDTADVYSAGESEEIVGKALAGTARRRRPRDEGPRADGRGPEHARQLAPLDHPRSARTACAACRPTTSTCTRSTVREPDTRHRRDARRADRSRARRARCATSARPRSRRRQIVEAQWTAEKRQRERFVCEQPPYSILVRGIEADVLPTCQRYGMGVIPWSPLAGGWLSGKWRVGAGRLTSRTRAAVPARYDLSVPANQRKLEAADALAELAEKAGMSLPVTGGGVGDQPPGDHVGHHRPPDDGAAHVTARRGRRAHRRRDPGRDRRDRAARNELHLGGRGLRTTVDRKRLAEAAADPLARKAFVDPGLVLDLVVGVGDQHAADGAVGPRGARQRRVELLVGELVQQRERLGCARRRDRRATHPASQRGELRRCPGCFDGRAR